MYLTSLSSLSSLSSLDSPDHQLLGWVYLVQLPFLSEAELFLLLLLGFSNANKLPPLLLFVAVSSMAYMASNFSLLSSYT